MLINVSYFVSGPRHIQNASSNANLNMEAQSVKNSIEGYIKFYEPMFLHDMLGGSMSEMVCERLKALENGASDTSPVDVLIEKLKEPFADYVFFEIIKASNTQPTVTGTVRLKSANEYVNPNSLLVDTWYRMVNANMKFIEWVNTDECPYKITMLRNMITPINVMNI